MSRKGALGAFLATCAFYPLIALAQDTTPPAVQMAEFMSQVLAVVNSIGGLTTIGKASAIITIIISSMKVSPLKVYWDRLGAAQAWVAPIMGIAAGILGIGAGGATVTPALIVVYLTAGAGAVFLHEILDSIKAVPGIGRTYVWAINFVEWILSRDSNAPAPTSFRKEHGGFAGQNGRR